MEPEANTAATPEVGLDPIDLDGVESGASESDSTDLDPIDLDRVERDLDDVQAALVRLNDGEYWTDEVTGETLPDELLADNPTARTVASRH